MAKIDFSKVEQNLHQAMHMIFVKNLVAGKEVAHRHAVLFLGHHLDKPSPQDSVVEAINEWRMELAVDETVAETQKELALPQMEPVSAPDEEKAAQNIPQEEYLISPLYKLRKHLLWFIRKRVANIYKLLGTTKEEVIELRKKKNLSEEEQKRVQEILVKSQEINQRLMKKLGIDTDDALIEKEVKKHRTKRFNIRESWLPL